MPNTKYADFDRCKKIPRHIARDFIRDARGAVVINENVYFKRIELAVYCVREWIPYRLKFKTSKKKSIIMVNRLLAKTTMIKVSSIKVVRTSNDSICFVFVGQKDIKNLTIDETNDISRSIIVGYSGRTFVIFTPNIFSSSSNEDAGKMLKKQILENLKDAYPTSPCKEDLSSLIMQLEI
jgi:hypothetical protein